MWTPHFIDYTLRILRFFPNRRLFFLNQLYFPGSLSLLNKKMPDAECYSLGLWDGV